MNTLAKSLLTVLLWLPLQACALSGETIEGKVLEESTNKPLAGAIVVVRWHGTAFSFVESPTVCVHVETATTDEQGRYRIAAWREEAPIQGVRDVRPTVTAYKAGYQRSEGDERNVQYLRPFTGSRGERLDYLKRVSSASGCPTAGASEKNLLSLRRALLDEAKKLTETKSDQDVIEGFLFQVEAIELGYEAAERRQVERLRGKK